MTKRINFTKRTIEAIQPPATGHVYVYDTGQANLALCVLASGIKTFYWIGRAEGRPERVKLGRWPDTTVENARKAARTKNAGRDAGVSPKRQRHDQRTLQDLFDRWLSHAKLTKRSWPEDEAKWRYCFGRLKNRRLSEVTTADVATWHTKLGEERGTVLANRARALLSAIYSKAHEMGYDGPNPCSGVARFPEQSRERYLRDDEIRPFFLAVKAEPAEWRDFWLLCLFTGARRGSVAAMEWREVDLKQAAWNLPASKTKNKKPAIIYLPPPAVAILETRQQDRNGKPYVFPSNSEAGHIKDPRKSWDRIITAAGLDDFHPHDLRRTLGSVQARLGASLQVIGASLGHRDHRSTEVYARLAEAPVQQSVQSAVAFLVDAGEPEQPAKKSSKGAAKTKGAKKSHARKGAKNGKAK